MPIDFIGLTRAAGTAWKLLPGFPKLRIQSGHVAFPRNTDTIAMWDEGRSFKGIRKTNPPIHITFDPPPFSSPPQIVVGLAKLDLRDKTSAHIHRINVYYENVRITGFDLIFETWEDSIVWDATASWIAYGQ